MRWLVLVLALGACTGAPDVNDWVSIDQGVYGQLRVGCDAATDCKEGPLTDTMVFAQLMDSDTGVATISNGDGFYQLSLEPANYVFCLPGACDTVTVAATELVHLDYVQTEDGGDWTRVIEP